RIYRPPLTSTLFPYTPLFRPLDGTGRQPPRLARPPEGRDGLRGDDERDRVVPAPVQQGGRRLAGSGEVARPPADLGQVEQRVLRSEEHTSELQSLTNLVCRLL